MDHMSALHQNVYQAEECSIVSPKGLLSLCSFQYYFWTERKDKVEEGNKVLVQKFQSELTEQLELLHNTVSASVLQQESQLQELESDMQSFVSSKSEAFPLAFQLLNKA